tara:strand:+ start:5220 stop:7055 length:1836 start_codon:yes stop_codon:yes gene_type:complete
MRKGLNGRVVAFLAASLCLLLSDVALVQLNLRSSHREFEAILEERAYASMSVYDQYIHAMENSMVQLATFVASDPETMDLVERGFQAASAGNEEEANVYRTQLFEEMIDSWQPLQDAFHYRQLHFHQGPGDTSFLRVHKPEKFGDDLSSVRHTIVDAIAENRITYGFESGRVYAGLRGVVPLVVNGECIGALEAGMSLRNILGELHEEAGDDFAVLLDESYVRETVWEDQLNKVFGTSEANANYFIEATTSPFVNEILGRAEEVFEREAGQVTYSLLEFGDEWFVVRMKPLIDYRSERDGEYDGVGLVLSWSNVSEAVARQDQIFRANLITAAIGYVLVELLLFFGFRLGTRSLRRHIENQKASLSFANERLRRFNHLVSHDLKTPFAGIVSLAEIIENDLDRGRRSYGAEDFSALKEHNATIQSVASDALELINGLLESSEEGEGEILAAPVLVSDLLKSARKQLELRLADKQGRIVEKDTEHKVVVNGAEFVQVLVNLIDNSLKYSSPERSPEIVVDVQESEEEVLIVVEDNGRGIPEEELHSIFRNRQRVEEDQTEDGHGIGLFIVRRIVRENLGEIRAFSTIGEGTRMEIRLPRFFDSQESTDSAES